MKWTELNRISMHCVFFSSFPVGDIWSHSIVVREDPWYDFSFLKFIQSWFVTQDVVYPEECSTCTKKVLKMSIRSSWSNVSFKICVSLLILWVDDLSIGVSGVKVPYGYCVTVDFPLMPVVSALCILCWVHKYLQLLYFLLGLIPWSLYSVLLFLF